MRRPQHSLGMSFVAWLFIDILVVSSRVIVVEIFCVLPESLRKEVVLFG